MTMIIKRKNVGLLKNSRWLNISVLTLYNLLESYPNSFWKLQDLAVLMSCCDNPHFGSKKGEGKRIHSILVSWTKRENVINASQN